MTTPLSPDQKSSVIAFRNWCGSDAPVFRLDGPAGTGKTTIAKQMAAATTAPTIYTAPTGKAASRLSTKVGEPAVTLHSLLFTPRTVEEPDPRNPKRTITRPAFSDRGRDLDGHLVIVDEASMVPKFVGEALVRTGARVLVIGDSAQLSPVKSATYFTDDDRYPINAHLTSIHRQAHGNLIIDRATDIRTGKAVPFGSTPEFSLSRDASGLTVDDLLAADQVLCATHLQRHAINTLFRERLNLRSSVAVGDKMVCMRNDTALGVLNGTMWEVVGIEGAPPSMTAVMRSRDGFADGDIRVPLRSADAPIDPKRDYGEDVLKNPQDYQPWLPHGFTHGYAITTHKSQGSEWDHVVVAGHGVWSLPPYGGTNGARWWYTAVTRASRKVTAIESFSVGDLADVNQLVAEPA